MLAGTAEAIEISAAGGPPVAASGRESRPRTIFLYYYPSIFVARRDDFMLRLRMLTALIQKLNAES